VSGGGSRDRSRCLWASCGPDRGRSAACARRGPGPCGRGSRIGGRSRLTGVLAGHGPVAGIRGVPLGPVVSHCGQLCADAWRTGSGRVITGFRGPAVGHRVTCGRHQGRKLALTEGENSPGACAMRFAPPCRLRVHVRWFAWRRGGAQIIPPCSVCGSPVNGLALRVDFPPGPGRHRIGRLRCSMLSGPRR